MGKINVPKVVRPLKLAEYAPEFEGEILVWVNPPRSILSMYAGLAGAAEGALVELRAAGTEEAAQKVEKTGRALIEWYAGIWSQGPEDTRWPVEQIKELIEGTVDTDPRLWPWLAAQTLRMISEHRAMVKKDSPPHS
jgi:hypothetical protein